MMKFISDDNKQKFKSDSVTYKIFSIKTPAIKLLNGLKKMKV